ncbi:ATP-dependent acyl-CoA ligase [Acrocarpospora corrugata]|uniref:ATP-dependent acyl-CoA ligase n=1 Tax=Acrocarpospora corrugata TaxID=35763 RepID=A0A5M3W970_9ACTN|nr:AMP-binding protein [Acrocarpospora corrugata]GES04770.1 ATP-dependent acyl-CoA ligase [Acrocarpospora corrugata]
MKYFRELRPTFADRTDWALPAVLRQHAAARPDAVWLDAPEEGRTWTFAQMLAAAEAVGGGLIEAGAVPGERVVIVAGNSSRFVRSWLGCAVAGLVEVPISTAYQQEVLADQVGTVKARFAIVDDVYAERFAEITEAAQDIERFWVIDTGRLEDAIRVLNGAGWPAAPWDDLEAPRDVDLPVVSPRDLGAIMFTSGVGGPAKGVAMPHAQMYFFADLSAALTRLTPADVWLAVTPLFHVNARFMAAYPTLVTGARFVLRSRFGAGEWLGQIRESLVTVTNVIGVMMDFVWKQPPRPDDADNTLRCVLAVPTAAALVEPMKARFGIEAFVEVFGLTEIGAPIATPYGEDRPPGACGLQADEWFEVALVDPDTDEEVDTGELVVRPKVPFICGDGYFGRPDRTVEAWRNLWFHTGDVLRRDADGWFYFVDRVRETLRRSGENFSPGEVEAVILAHPAVLECCVVAVPGEDEVMAYLIVGDEVSPEEVWAWCDSRIPNFAVPRYLRFVADLPKTPSQRVQRNTLRAAGVTPDTHDRVSMG